jgi:hypothetical protein
MGSLVSLFKFQRAVTVRVENHEERLGNLKGSERAEEDSEERRSLVTEAAGIMMSDSHSRVTVTVVSTSLTEPY